ncbi:putative sterol 3-beta-glucosyltransferase [Rosa chinensis]|uniref:Putative sterol 3-beta-glucosyltransferase n=1 Tax=Rosa chinensis TaxID=74649 RepID=A0A2P6PGQ3_ROSCH|nr:putative sterol 3-beta-glucosyltransferase [Rosa chinensis]
MTLCSPTSEYPHPLSCVKQHIGYRVSLISNLNILLILICIGAFVGQFFILLLNNFFFSFQLSYQIVDALIWLAI